MCGGQSWGVTNLIELVEVSQYDCVIREGREELFSHPPSSALFLLPIDLTFTQVAGLGVIAAEEGFTAKDDIFGIDPVIGSPFRFISKDIFDMDITAVRA